MRKFLKLGAPKLVVVFIFTISLSLLATTRSVSHRGEYYTRIGDESFGYRPTGGFPLPYLYDVDGISIMNQLGPEDDFRSLPFLLDCGFYFAVLSIGSAAVVKAFELLDR